MGNKLSPEKRAAVDEALARITEVLAIISPNPPDPEEFILSLEDYAHSVGTLCQNWAHLETAVRGLLRGCARLPPDAGSDLVLRCFDFRDQLNAIKVAAVGLTIPPKLADEIIETANYIDNTLRPRRNRLVHDLWIEVEGARVATRMEIAPKIRKPQAHQRPVVQIDVQPDDIDAVLIAATTVARHFHYVKRITDTLEQPTRQRIAALLATRPQRPLFRPPPETPRPAGKRKQAPSRPRRSSRGKSQPRS